jgi:WD40 repeat protein
LISRYDCTRVLAIDWLTDGEFYVSAHEQAKLVLFSRRGKRLGEYELSGCTVHGLVGINKQRFMAATSNESGQYQLVMLRIQSAVFDVLWTVTGQGTTASMSPVYHDTFVLVSANGSSTVDLWDIQQQRLVQQYTRTTSNGWARCAFVGTASEYVIGADKNDLVVWNRADGQVVTRLSMAMVRGVAVHPTNRTEFVAYAATGVLSMHVRCVTD